MDLIKSHISGRLGRMQRAQQRKGFCMAVHRSVLQAMHYWPIKSFIPAGE